MLSPIDAQSVSVHHPRGESSWWFQGLIEQQPANDAALYAEVFRGTGAPVPRTTIVAFDRLSPDVRVDYGAVKLTLMRRHRLAIGLALAIVLLALANIAAEAYLASFGPPGLYWPPRGGVAEALYDLRHGFTFLLAPLLIPAALILLAVAAWRALKAGARPTGLARAAGVLLAGSVVLGIGVPWATHAVRIAGFERAAERMEPLVGAIARFEREHGAAPARLDQLAPAYVRDVRSFGVRGCRPMEYRPNGAPGTWELHMDCSNGFLTLDRFFYRPSGSYGPHEHHQLFRAWAYFWD